MRDRIYRHHRRGVGVWCQTCLGTGTPEAGGLEAREALALLRAHGGLNVIGADVVEVAPQYDPTTSTSQLAAQLLFEEFALMALR
jgi:arginase family enzyme